MRLLEAEAVIADLRDRHVVEPERVLQICSAPAPEDAQAGALLSLLIGPRGAAHALALEQLLSANPSLRRLSGSADGAGAGAGNMDASLCREISAAVRKGQSVGLLRWTKLAKRAADGDMDRASAGFVMMEVLQGTLSSADRFDLATALRDSGQIYDYREPLRPRRLVRRYPTGALSEKVALILPAVIAAVSDTLAIASNFLVARSLSFTGGTFDKLSAIPGFRFPEAGAATLGALKAHRVAMCVTSHDVAPADRFFYQVRSLTGTVESEDLIVTSVASKQGALPCDRLLLDVRFGDGAFLRDHEAATRVGDGVATILRAWGIPTHLSYLDTPWPTGAAIGNALEVSEAVAILSGRGDGWPPDLLDQQWKIVEDFLNDLVRLELDAAAAERAVALAREMRRDGRLNERFGALLVWHGVSPRVAEQVTKRPLAHFYEGNAGYVLTAAREGRVASLDQRRLGTIINLELGGGGNEIAGHHDPLAGIRLHVRKDQPVTTGQPLCTVYSQRGASDPQLLRALRDCFEVEPEPD